MPFCKIKNEFCSISDTISSLSDVQCQYCGQILSVESENLVLLHTKLCEYVERHNANYKHVCYICSYHTFSGQHMTYHLRKHSGEKPYQCTFCKYRCATNCNLRSHLRTRHGRSNAQWQIVILAFKLILIDCFIFLIINISMCDRLKYDASQIVKIDLKFCSNYLQNSDVNIVAKSCPWKMRTLLSYILNPASM